MRRLEAWHSRLLGPEARRGHLYPGFYMLLGGVALGLSGLGLFLYSSSLPTPELYPWREVAVSLAALSAPLVFLGISFALPGRLAVRAVSLLGGAVSAAMIGAFVVHYPHNFNVPGTVNVDHAPLDASIYLAGIALLIASILVQLISYYVRRQQGESGDGEDWAGTDYDVPDWLIEKDIDDAMRLYPARWGDGAGSAVKSISINVDDALEPGSQVFGDGVAKEASVSVPDMDKSTRRLHGMNADEVDLNSQEADSNVDRLLELRQMQKKDPKRYLPHKRSWWHSLFRRDRHKRLRRRAADNES